MEDNLGHSISHQYRVSGCKICQTIIMIPWNKTGYSILLVLCVYVRGGVGWGWGGVGGRVGWWVGVCEGGGGGGGGGGWVVIGGYFPHRGPMMLTAFSILQNYHNLLMCTWIFIHLLTKELWFDLVYNTRKQKCEIEQEAKTARSTATSLI